MYYSSIINKILKKLKSILGLRAQILLSVFLTISGLQQVTAQCGAAAALIPQASTTRVCPGSLVTLTLHRTNVIRWVYRQNNGSWVNVPNSFSSVYTFSSASVQGVVREYRAIVSHTTCVADTSGPVFIQFLQPSYGSNASIAPYVSKDTACSKSTVFVGLSDQYAVHQWIYKDNDTAAWSELTASKANAIPFIIDVATGVVKRQVRALIKRDDGCFIDTVAPVPVVFKSPVYGNRTEIVPFTAAPEVCRGTAINLSVSPSLKVEIWQTRNNNGSWQNSTGASNHTSTTTGVNSTTQRSFRVLVLDSISCKQDTSSLTTVLIKANRGNNNSIIPITSTTSVCSGTDVNLRSNTPTVDRWLQQDNDTGLWVPITGSSTTGYNQAVDYNTIVAATRIRKYRILVFNNLTCSIDTSAAQSVTIRPYQAGSSNSLVPKILSKKGTICSGTHVVLSNQTSLHRFIASNNISGSWQNVLSIDTATTVTAPTVRRYRMIVTDPANCRLDSSKEISISVMPAIHRGMSIDIHPYADYSEVCAGKIIQLNIQPTTNYHVSHWLYNINGGSFQLLNGSKGNTVPKDSTSSVVSATTRRYKALLYNHESCFIDSSWATTVIIEPERRGNAAQVKPAVSKINFCGGSEAVEVGINLPDGYVVKNWLWRENNAAWQTLASTTASISHSTGKVSVSTTRTYRVLLYNSGLCRTDTSASVTVNVLSRSGGNMFNIKPTASGGVTLVCGPDYYFSVNVTPPSGYATQGWVWRDNGGAWNVDSTQNALRSSVLQNTQRDIRAILYQISGEACTVDTTAALQITLRPYTNGNYADVFPVCSTATVCYGNSINLTPATATIPANFMGWQVKDNDSSWYYPLANNVSSFTDLNTRVNADMVRSYRYVYTNKGCTVDTSNVIKVNIKRFLPGTSVLNAVIYPATKNVCSNSTVQLSLTPSNLAAKDWFYRDNGGNWKQMNSRYDDNTQVNQITLREYRATYTSVGHCILDTSAITQVKIKPITYLTNEAFAISSTSSACAWSNSVVNISGFSNVVYWMQKRDNGNWQILPSVATSLNFDNRTLPINTSSVSYRVVLNNNSNCSVDTSRIVTVMLHQPAAGNLPETPTGLSVFCADGQGNPLSITPPTGYTVNKWLQRDGPLFNWNDFAQVTKSMNTVTDYNLKVQGEIAREYRVLLQNEMQCKLDSSRVLYSSLLSTKGRTVNSWLPYVDNSKICSGREVRVTRPPNMLVTDWIFKENDKLPNSMNVSSNTITHYTYDVADTTVRTYYAIRKSTSHCRIDTSAGVSVVAFPITYGVDTVQYQPIVSPAGTVCEGSTINIRLNNWLVNSKVQNWIYRENNGPWISVKDTHQINLYGAPVTRKYRAIIGEIFNSNLCRIDTTSTEVNVNISPVTYSKNTSLSLTATDTICSGGTSNINLMSSNSVIKWLYRDNPLNSWKVIPNQTSALLTDNSTIVNSPTLRNYVSLSRNTTGCSIDTSATAVTRILPTTPSNSTTVKVVAPDSVCAYSPSINLSVSGANVKHWIFRSNINQNWTELLNSNNAVFVHQIKDLHNYTFLEYKAILFNPNVCRIDSSVSDTVRVYYSIGGTSSTSTWASVSSYCEGGSSPSIGTFGFAPGETISGWIYRDNHTGPWKLLSNLTSTTIVDNTTEFDVTFTRSYRALLNNSIRCSRDTTAQVSIVFNKRTLGNTSVVINASGGSTPVCSGTQISLSASTGSNQSVYNWLFRNDTQGVWRELIHNFGTDENTFTEDTITRFYRAIIYNSSTCRLDTTAAISKGINSPGAGFNTSVTLPSPSSICHQTSFGVSIITNSLNRVRGWVYSINNDPWIRHSTITPATSSTFTSVSQLPTPSTVIRSRAILFNYQGCRFDSSNIYTVNVSAAAFGKNNSINLTAPATACFNSKFAVQVSSSLPSGFSISGWLYRDNNSNWNLIPSSSSSIIDSNTAVFGNTTREYRVLLRNSSLCLTDSSNSTTVILIPRSGGNDNSITPSGPSTTCSESTVNLTVSAGSGNIVTEWISRKNNNGVWTKLPIVNSLNSIFVSHPVETSSYNVQYRALILKGSSCSVDTSSSHTVQVNGGYGNNTTSTYTPTTASSTYCMGTTVTVNVSFTNSIVFQWLFRDNNTGPWRVLATGNNYSVTDNPQLSASASRAYRALIQLTGSCTLDTTNEKTVNLTQLSPSNITAQPTLSASSICSGDSVVITYAIESELIYRFNGATNWTHIKTPFSYVDYDTEADSLQTKTYRYLRSNYTTCKLDSSSPRSLNINPSKPGNLSIIPNINDSIICSGTAVTLTIPAGNNVVGWLHRRNNSGVWVPLTGSTNSEIFYAPEVIDTTYFSMRAIIQSSNSCKRDTTGERNLMVAPYKRGNVSNSPSTSTSQICSGSWAYLTFSSGNVNSWMFRNNQSGSWQVVSNSNSSFYDLSTNVTAPTARSYRVLLVNNNLCLLDTSAQVTVNILPISSRDTLLQPTLSSNSICSGDTVRINISTSGATQLNKWLYRLNNTGPWITLPGTQFNPYSDSQNNYIIPTQKSYKALLFTSSQCRYDTSAQISIAIQPYVRGNNNMISPQLAKDSVCYGENALVTYQGLHPISKWLYTDNLNSPWNDINTTSKSFTDTTTYKSLTSYRYYRAIEHNKQSCSFDTTAVVKITVKQNGAGNNNTISPVTASDSVCANAIVSLTLPGSVQVTKWLLSDDLNYPWYVINNNTSSFNDNTTQNNVTQNRFYRVIVYNKQACSFDTTNYRKIRFKTPTRGNDNSIVPSVSSKSICSGGLLSAIFSGNVSQWVYRDDHTGPWIPVSYGLNNLVLTNTVVSKPTIRSVRVIIELPNCRYDTSAATNVSINPNGPINDTISPTAQPDVLCSGNKVTLKLSNYKGHIVNWLYRDNGGLWVSLPSGVDSLVQTLTTVGKREYKLEINTGCISESTLVRNVTIHANPIVPLISRAGDSLLSPVTSGVSYEWALYGVPITNGNIPRIKPTKSGVYTVKLTNTFGCSSISANYTFLFTDVAVTGKLDATIYPNPTTGELHVQLPEVYNNVTVSVLSVIGEVVQVNERSNTSAIDLQLGNLPRGMYLIKVNGNGKQHIERIVLQ